MDTNKVTEGALIAVKLVMSVVGLVFIGMALYLLCNMVAILGHLGL